MLPAAKSWVAGRQFYAAQLREVTLSIVMNETKDLAGLVNASGFALQLAIEKAVEDSSSEHSFELEAHEHPWKTTEDRGFIDLIFGRSNVRLVCECKRPREGIWVFLREEDRSHVDRARLLWLNKAERGMTSGWHDFHLRTASPESAFCVIRGKGENDDPMLERTARRLILSVEALANEETAVLDDDDDTRVYVPVILTTAELRVCRYDPLKIKLTSGTITDESYEKSEMISFRKAFTPTRTVERRTDEMAYRAFRRLSLEQERTVLVINATAFIQTLRAWTPTMIGDDHSPPWEPRRSRRR